MLLYIHEQTKTHESHGCFEPKAKQMAGTTKINEKISFIEWDTFSVIFCSSTCGVIFYNHNHIDDQVGSGSQHAQKCYR